MRRHPQVDQNLESVLASCGVRPVLLDLGASGAPPAVWQAFAGSSIYVGFDPDARELTQASAGFAELHMVPQAAVVGDESTVRFHLTRYPFCSSTLSPDASAREPYLFAEPFEVVEVSDAPATSLGSALAQLGLSRVHWFKADTQGTDLRLFESLPKGIRDGVLAVDVAPRLIPAYLEEDLFVDAHHHLTGEGFWLSRLEVHGAIRMRRSSLKVLEPLLGTACVHELASCHRPSPCWCEARYFRTLDSLRDRERGDWIVAWAFAMVDEQPAFAADLAIAYRERFGVDAQGAAMLAKAAAELKRIHCPHTPSQASRAKAGPDGGPQDCLQAQTLPSGMDVDAIVPVESPVSGDPFRGLARQWAEHAGAGDRLW